jgi:hypothetical protein
MMNMKKIFCLIIVATCIAGSTWSELTGTYVEANLRNTTKVGVWTWRPTPSGYSGKLFQGGNTTLEFPDAYLVTTITGLTPGAKYRVGVVYIGRKVLDNWHWHVLSTFNTNSTWTTNYYGDGVSTMDTSNGSSYRMQAILGTTTADHNGEIAVYIARHEYGILEDRVMYNGLTYEKVSEPVTVELLGMGVFFAPLIIFGIRIIRRRSRQK